MRIAIMFVLLAGCGGGSSSGGMLPTNDRAAIEISGVTAHVQRGDRAVNQGHVYAEAFCPDLIVLYPPTLNWPPEKIAGILVHEDFHLKDQCRLGNECEAWKRSLNFARGGDHEAFFAERVQAEC